MSTNNFVESNQNFAVNLAMGLLAWVFSVTVFLPVTNVYAPDWARLIALLLIIDITYYLYKAKAHSSLFFEYISNRVTTHYISWRKLGEADRPEVWRKIKKVQGACLTLVVYLLYRPLLTAVSIVLPGVMFILVLLQIFKYVVLPVQPINS